MFKLTVTGEDAAENTEMKPSTESKILSYMYMVGANKSLELEELQDQVRLSDEKTVLLLRRMVNEGLIEEV